MAKRPVEPGSAVIFGARGAIGSAVAERLVHDGCHDGVYAGGRVSPDKRPGLVPFAFDLADEASIETATRRFQPLPVLTLVATGMLHDVASGQLPEKTLRAIDPDAMRRSFEINTIGPALIAKHVLPVFPRDRRAVFAVLSARVGSIGDNRLGGWHAYRASKAALVMLVRNFAIEMRRSHPLAIVVALHPGTVASALSEPFQRGVPDAKLFSPQLSADHLIDVVDALTPADSGGHFAWDGSRIPE